MALGFSANERVSMQGDALKQQLLQSIVAEKSRFSAIATAFYEKEHRTQEDFKVFSVEIKKVIDTILNEGDWESSLFLRNTVKPLQALRQEVEDLQKAVEQAASPRAVEPRVLQEDERWVYISIFQNQGHHLRKWELQLNSLRSHLLGRPVYEKEEDVQRVIRQKLIQISEAYVVVAIKKQDVQAFAYQAKRVDRQGNTLLTLKENAVKPENITKFVHQGKQYYFIKDKLVLQP